MAFVALNTPIFLPWPAQSGLEAAARALLQPSDQPRVDFSRPLGEAALLSSDSVSWRIFKSPLSLFIGGVAAVIMELAEPRVRTGVWEHTTFRTNPIGRLRRTGLAAMVLRLLVSSQPWSPIRRCRPVGGCGFRPPGRAFAARPRSWSRQHCGQRRSSLMVGALYRRLPRAVPKRSLTYR
jgi:hypothetical protein